MIIISIDPGRDKCGIAILDEKANVIKKSVISTCYFDNEIRGFTKGYNPDVIIIGDGTGRKLIKEKISSISGDIPIKFVREDRSTLEARRRYFQDNPPRGLRRLLPISLLIPPETYDDYVAVILGERYLASDDLPSIP